MLRIFQRCQNATGWTVVDVDSTSDPSVVYRVVISEWDYICDCKGFEFNGKCKHREIADILRCRWEEGDDPNQSAMERSARICPQCGAPTLLVAEREYDGEDSE